MAEVELFFAIFRRQPKSLEHYEVVKSCFKLESDFVDPGDGNKQKTYRGDRGDPVALDTRVGEINKEYARSKNTTSCFVR